MPAVAINIPLPFKIEQEKKIIEVVRPFRRCTSTLYNVYKHWYSVRKTTIAIHFLSKEKFEIIDVTDAVNKQLKRK